MKRIKGLLLSFLGIVIILAVGSWLIRYLQTLGPMAPLAQSWREASNRVVLLVNGEPATEREWVIQYEELRLNPQNAAKSDHEIKVETLENVIRNKALLVEALGKGYRVNEEEARVYAEEQRKALQSPDAVPEDRAFLENFIKGLGVSEEEYWGKIAPQAYMLLLPQIHLRESLRATFQPLTFDELEAFKEKHPEWKNLAEEALALKAQEEKFQDFWEDYARDLVRKAKIEILAPDLKEIQEEALKAFEVSQTE